ncbi:signal recognition particle protein [Lineolata rhizophorae]|uniref:Signal recognition particle protein n=1 Tax=Lineolata rhizophorae TaxID=578093 RepID=A0A6A6PDA2_9PEZI|nr:signal recognition particle protein [Lineolata rhizophorae]
MSHARVEEVSDSDSDPGEMDPSDFDPASFARASLMQPTDVPAASSPPPQPLRQPNQERAKRWQCLYPIYFDSSRSRAEGRRVGKEAAVPNPLAREIVDAVHSLGLNFTFEPTKRHPKDWANPGRVRVLLKDENGAKVARNVNNKHHLYNLVSAYLKLHPATMETPLRFKIPGLPPPKDPSQGPAIPRGWKMNSILPLHSAALGGSGVSENFFKEMMAEMQGESPGASGSESKPKKKDKKKGKN